MSGFRLASVQRFPPNALEKVEAKIIASSDKKTLRSYVQVQRFQQSFCVSVADLKHETDYNWLKACLPAEHLAVIERALGWPLSEAQLAISTACTVVAPKPKLAATLEESPTSTITGIDTIPPALSLGGALQGGSFP